MMLKDKVIIVSGIGAGLGIELARLAAREGAKVAISCRTVSFLRESEEELKAAGADVLAQRCDISQEADCVALAKAVTDRWGRIDGLVNNGTRTLPFELFENVDLAEWEVCHSITLFGALRMAHACVPGLKAAGGGAIVNITSSLGYADPPSAAGEGGWGLGYGMSKAAMHRVAGILKLELGQHGIRTFNVQPGFIATERIAQDMAKFGFDASKGAPCDVPARVVRFLVTDPAAEKYNGRNIEAQQLCHELGLMPEWPGPGSAGKSGGLTYDMSAYNMFKVAQGEKFTDVYGTLAWAD